MIHYKKCENIHKFLTVMCIILWTCLDLEGRSPNATLVVVLVVVIIVVVILKIPKAFLISSGVQQNFVYTHTLIFPTDLLSEIIKLIRN